MAGSQNNEQTVQQQPPPEQEIPSHFSTIHSIPTLVTTRMRIPALRLPAHRHSMRTKETSTQLDS